MKNGKFANIKDMLTRDQMKQIKGGSLSGGYCIGSVGSWVYPNGGSLQDCETTIALYCRSGEGHCS